MRFFLEPGPKQRFFDFIQGDLESSLEKLNKRNEEDWYSYVDVNAFKEIHLGEKFFKYKEEINTLRSTLGEHFSRVIIQIEAGLPDVKDEKGENESDLVFTDTSWTCPTCTVVNQSQHE